MNNKDTPIRFASPYGLSTGRLLKSLRTIQQLPHKFRNPEAAQELLDIFHKVFPEIKRKVKL